MSKCVYAYGQYRLSFIIAVCFKPLNFKVSVICFYAVKTVFSLLAIDFVPSVKTVPKNTFKDLIVIFFDSFVTHSTQKAAHRCPTK